MILSIRCKKKIIYEEIRTATIDNDKLCYYRQSHYPGELHKIDLKEIEMAHLQGNAGTIIWEYNAEDVKLNEKNQ